MEDGAGPSDCEGRSHPRSQKAPAPAPQVRFLASFPQRLLPGRQAGLPQGQRELQPPPNRLGRRAQSTPCPEGDVGADRGLCQVLRALTFMLTGGMGSQAQEAFARCEQKCM